MVPARTNGVLGYSLCAAMGRVGRFGGAGEVVLNRFNDNQMIELLLAFKIFCL